jgi:hypothetical protein
MPMISIALLALSAPNNIVVTTREPRAADRWTQQVEFKCAGDSLRIVGFGTSRPAGGTARVMFNGRPLTGAGADALRRDLSSARAVYRLTARCSYDRRGFGLAIYVGEKPVSGPVSYRVGAVFIQGPRLEHYDGLAPADADSFWFR